MKKLKIGGICLLCSAAILFSCGKGGEINDDGTTSGGPHVVTPTDITAPVINISSPVTNQVYSNGNVITIAGTLSDDYGLYRGTIKLTNDTNGMNVINQPYEIHGLLSYNFSINHTAAVNMPTDFTATVSFEDHGLNTTTKTVKFKVNP